MDIHGYLHRSGHIVSVDLDDRTPLTSEEAYVLVNEQHRVIADREKLNTYIRKLTQRIIMSEKDDHGTE